MRFRPRFISPLSMLAQNVPIHEGLRGIEYRNASLSPINRQRARNVRISGVMTRSAVGFGMNRPWAGNSSGKSLSLVGGAERFLGAVMSSLLEQRIVSCEEQLRTNNRGTAKVHISTKYNTGISSEIRIGDERWDKGCGVVCGRGKGKYISANRSPSRTWRPSIIGQEGTLPESSYVARESPKNDGLSPHPTLLKVPSRNIADDVCRQPDGCSTGCTTRRREVQ